MFRAEIADSVLAKVQKALELGKYDLVLELSQRALRIPIRGLSGIAWIPLGASHALAAFALHAELVHTQKLDAIGTYLSSILLAWFCGMITVTAFMDYRRSERCPTDSPARFA